MELFIIFCIAFGGFVFGYQVGRNSLKKKVKNFVPKTQWKEADLE
ncbi:hypothetical protein NIES4074_49450 [Cylindrospermum sp. NIES-4074]|nr:hypothetical protein NIES4074_49450 [Cylindrospermum sp. NIES-4074]